jgi:general secretion pathway protein I
MSSGVMLMETSRADYCLNKNKGRSQGLTLIEVLIALAIIGIALTAIIKAASQNIRSTAYLQNKTIAMWTGQQVMNEVRAGLIKIPNPPDKLRQTTTMLGQEWNWSADQEETPSPFIRKIVVKVFKGQTSEEDEEASPIITLESYVNNEEK